MGVAVLTLSACSSAPTAKMVVYDFGPGNLTVQTPVGSSPTAGSGAGAGAGSGVSAGAGASSSAGNRARGAVLLADVDAPGVLDGNALLYRLSYAQAQQLHPYASARWSVPVAQLVRQRLRDQIGQRRAVLSPGDIPPLGAGLLRVELEEFSQVFDSPQSSAAWLRARVTLNRPVAASSNVANTNPASATPAPAVPVPSANAIDRALAQTVFVIRVPAPSPDAAGGARALAQAGEQLAVQLDQWLQQVLGEAAP